jgi:hypothetical protein
MGRPNVAIMFEPDDYVISNPKLMGRQMAGNVFPRATAVTLHSETLCVYTASHRSAEIFGELVAHFNPLADPMSPSCSAKLAHSDPPGSGPKDAARLRMRAGPSAYSLVGHPR